MLSEVSDVRWYCDMRKPIAEVLKENLHLDDVHLCNRHERNLIRPIKSLPRLRTIRVLMMARSLVVTQLEEGTFIVFHESSLHTNTNGVLSEPIP